RVRRGFDGDDRLLGERPNKLRDVIAVYGVLLDCSSRCSQIEASQENTETAKGDLLVFRQERIAPIQQRLQRLLAQRDRTVAVSQHWKSIVQPIEDFAETEHADSGGSQLYC